MEKISIQTKRRIDFIDITAEVQKVIAAGDVWDGICILFCPHTTAGLTINENADPAVRHDVIKALAKLAPADADYAHSEGNADSHVKSSLLGASLNIFVSGGKLLLGQWQGVYFCEGDGPRAREVWVKIISGS
jgi:secondary thiamine-phosphate synthase enzyme